MTYYALAEGFAFSPPSVGANDAFVLSGDPLPDGTVLRDFAQRFINDAKAYMVGAGLASEADALALAIDRYLRGTTTDFDEFDFFGEQARAVNYAQLRRTDADALFEDASWSALTARRALETLAAEDLFPPSPHGGVYSDYYLRGSGAFNVAPVLSRNAQGEVYVDGNKIDARAVCVSETPGYARPLSPSRVAVSDSGGALLAESAAATATVYYETPLGSGATVLLTIHSSRLLRAGTGPADVDVSLSGDAEISLRLSSQNEVAGATERFAELVVLPVLQSATLRAALHASGGASPDVLLSVEWRRRECSGFV